MNTSLLKKHINKYSDRIHKNLENYLKDKQEWLGSDRGNNLKLQKLA